MSSQNKCSQAGSSIEVHVQSAMKVAREAAAQQIATTWQQHAEAEKALHAKCQQLKETPVDGDVGDAEVTAAASYA